jgi:hypothetical protein
MISLPTHIDIPGPADFRAWQIDHYSRRLNDARTIEERSFIRRELFNLKKTTTYGTINIRKPNDLLGLQTILER